MAVNTIYKRYGADSKKPRCHPIVQAMGDEWGTAGSERRAPNWGNVSLTYVESLCQKTKAAHQDWHVDLNALDLTEYLQDVPVRMLWWIPQLPAAPQPTDGMSYSFAIL
jgi:hypothetical protein